jgi:hypothetical protein
MDPISLVVAAVAILGIIIVSIYMYKTDETIKSDTHNKLTNIVKQVNVTQRANYNLDIKQEQLLQDMKNKVKTDSVEFTGSNKYIIQDRNNRLVLGSGSNVTMSMDTSNLYVDNIRPHKDNLNLGMMTMDSKSNVINFAASNLNINGKYRISDTSNLLSITGGNAVKMNKIQLGDKFTFSGVGDKHANDNWLRMFNKDGTDYQGGMAMADLFVRDNANLVGNTYIRPNQAGKEIKIGDTINNPIQIGRNSHMPFTDGNTYIRPGQDGKEIKIGDVWANHVQIGKASHMPHPNGNTYIRPGQDGKEILIGDAWANHVQIGKASHMPHPNGNTYIRPGQNGKEILIGDAWANHVQIGKASHMPFLDGNTYIRPGQPGKEIKIGDEWASHVQIGKASHMPFTDGNTYIRPGQDGKNINIGDMWANHVNLGRSDGSGEVFVNSHWTKIRRHIDAHLPWHNNKKALFAGWASDQVVLGNNNTGGHDLAAHLPANTVASINPLHVHGNVTSTSAVCVGNTCMNEPELSRYKKTMPASGELCANNTCMSEADLQRFKSTITNDSVCVNDTCTNSAEFQRYKTSLPGNQVCVNDMCLNDTEIKQLKSAVAKPGEICINDTCINEENLRQIKMATSPLTSSSLLSQKVLGEN